MSDESELEAAWAALEGGDDELALRRFAALPDELAERRLGEAFAWLNLGRLDRAEAALERCAGLAEVEADYLWALSELRLLQWRPADAWRALERLAPDFRERPGELDSAFVDRLVLAAELMGHFDEAEELLVRAHAAAPDDYPLPPRLAPEAFDEVVEQAVRRLPEPFLSEARAIPIVIDPLPTAEVVDATATGHPPDILGLFVGRSRLEDSVEISGELPPTIYLFQRNLERACRDRDELVEEIHTTLYHELGHALGFDEEGLEAIGLE